MGIEFESDPSSSVRFSKPRVRTSCVAVAMVLLACATLSPARGGQSDPQQAVTRAELTGASSEAIRSVAIALYPRPEYEGKPWSSWGQGIALSDGRYLSGVGDHLGLDGNVYLYAYDPSRRELVRFADVLGVLGQSAGHWGYGKLHSQMVRADDSGIYFATYRGNRRGIQFDDVYQGDVLLRLDPDSLAVESLGVPVPGFGIPSLAASPDGRYLFGEAVDPDDEALLFRYDLETRRVDREIRHPAHAVLRAVLVASGGAAYVSTGDERLLRLENDQFVLHDAPLPAPMLRAVTLPAANGEVYGVTRNPPVFFAMDEDGRIRELGPASAYTASLALSPNQQSFYFVPDAHGGAWQQGAPLVEVDVVSGEQKTLLEIDPLIRAYLGRKAGGTYSIAVDRSRRRVFITMNVGPEDAAAAFGDVALIVVDLR